MGSPHTMQNQSSALELKNCTEKLVNGGRIDVLYTDLEKAFDRVPHRRVLRKLKSYNIHPDLIDWIQSFLSDRKQRVQLNGVYSSWGSVLKDRYWSHFTIYNLYKLFTR